MSFSLTDVTIGSTYMKGKTTLGYNAVGRVNAVLPGIGFRVRDCDGRGVMLWRDFLLVDEEAYDLADETVDDTRGMPGFPDCAFWESQGILPLFVASWHQYHHDPIPSPPGFLTSILSAYRDEAEAKGGAFLRAWSRQATDCLGYVLTRSDAPPLSLRDFPVGGWRSKEQVVEALVPAPGTMYETPKRPRTEATVPGAPARPSAPEQPVSDDDEEEDDEVQEDEEDQEGDEPEDQEEQQEEDEFEYIEDAEPAPEPKLFTLLTSPSFGPFVVMFIWAVYFGWLWRS